MPTYITLIRYTEQGFRMYKELAKAFEDVKQAQQADGVKLVDYFLTMGQFDAVAIREAPDDRTIAKQLLGAGALGNARIEILRAFTLAEAREIAADL